MNDSGLCLYCGEGCEHKFDDNGFCTKCPYICIHLERDEERGVCKDCGNDCSHAKHDRDGCCVVCGVKVIHHYENGVCRCGSEVPYVTDMLPDTLWQSCDQPGDLTDNIYDTHDYTRGLINDEYPRLCKHLTVYTPYGYSSSKKYDVVFLLPGTDMSERYFWEPMHYGENFKAEFRTMFDNMIKDKICNEVIIVGLNYFSGNGRMVRGMGTDSMQVGNELVNDILPYIINNYSTYAESSDIEDLEAAREHFGFIGASYGSIIMFHSLKELFPVVAWYGGISGGAVSAQSISEWIDDTPYPLGYLYMCAGDEDFLLTQTYDEYRDLDLYSEKFVAGENMMFQAINKAGHVPKVWANGIYNCLLMFFGKES